MAAALVPLLAACDAWEQAGHGPGNTRFNPEEAAITPDNVGSLSEAWSSHVDGSFSEPVLSGDRLYTTVASAGSGTVRSYDAATGAPVWTKPLPAPASPGTPGPVVLAGGALWASYSGGGASFCSSLLTRLDPATGDVLSTETTGPPLLGPVVADGTTVAFTTRGGCSQTGNQPQLVVRDTGTPSASWTYRFPAGGNPPITPTLGDGRIFVAVDGDLHAFDADGCGAPSCAPIWTTSLDLDDAEVVADRPAVGPDGIVYVAVDTQFGEALVRALDADSGTHLWRTDRHPGPGSSWQGLTVTGDRLYVSDHRYAGGSGGAVEAFAAAGCGQPVCAPLWSAAVDGPPVAGLTVGGDVLYLGLFDEDDSRFVAFDAGGCGAAVCSRLANVGFGDEQPLRVAVAGGRVAVVGAGPSGETLRVLVPSP